MVLDLQQQNETKILKSRKNCKILMRHSQLYIRELKVNKVVLKLQFKKSSPSPNCTI